MKSELDEQIETLVLLQEVRELSASRKEGNERLTEQVLAYKVQVESKDRYIDTLQKKAISASIVTEYLRTWLQVFESKFESDERPEVTEASDYLFHAKWMREHCGREDFGHIATVQAWYDSQPVK